MTQVIFSPEIYRLHNLDLRHLSDAEATLHFMSSPHERRIFGHANSTQAFMSMRWLRGSGLEIGAGANPTPLFGNAKAVMNDCDEELAFGGTRLDFQASVDSPDFAKNGKLFDFSIACHVLEHADSFLRAVGNLVDVTRKGGIVYLVLPDIDWLHDHKWMPFFDFQHHVTEYNEPFAFAKLHDDVYMKGAANGIDSLNVHAHLSPAYKEAIKSGHIPQEMRFMHHKHNYRFEDWLALMLQARQFFDGAFRIADARFGHDRLDCHFVLEVTR